MANLIKNCRLRLGSCFNKFIVDQTNERDIRSLMASLHPFSYDKELIRLGSGRDGGYLVPNDLEGIAACFSPGVADSSSLEFYCAELGMDVFMADHSVEGPAAQHERFHFTKKFVGVTTNDQFMTLDKWVQENVKDPDSELFLQIDIEGFEYEVFMAASDQLMQRFRIIVAEFHRLDFLWCNPFFKTSSRVFEKILQTHVCVHAHPNNGRGSIKKGDIEIPLNMEFTFARKDRALNWTHSRDFPHFLDTDNVLGKPPLDLPSCWYSSST
ncbi:MAG: Uncharacterised protein [Gammaproteobacteria bacterium]|nr:MAG: Uncharacterised protein [Gammaproteobacteria bacterium]